MCWSTEQLQETVRSDRPICGTFTRKSTTQCFTGRDTGVFGAVQHQQDTQSLHQELDETVKNKSDHKLWGWTAWRQHGRCSGQLQIPWDPTGKWEPWEQRVVRSWGVSWMVERSSEPSGPKPCQWPVTQLATIITWPQEEMAAAGVKTRRFLTGTI